MNGSELIHFKPTPDASLYFTDHPEHGHLCRLWLWSFLDLYIGIYKLFLEMAKDV